MSANSLVRIEPASKRFGSGPVVLDNISLSAKRGEFVGLIGSSGCGKSTPLRLIAGLTEPTAGELVVDGMMPADARELMFFVFQDANLMPWRKVAETSSCRCCSAAIRRPGAPSA